MTYAAIIQARTNSSRLPNKILLNYKNISPLSVLVKRLSKSKCLKKIIIATTTKKNDDKIVKFCNENKILCFRGDENNVLKRYYLAAKKFKINKIVRITSDCPLVDYRILDQMIRVFKRKKIDYYANSLPLPSKYPDGMDIEIFTFKTLKTTFRKALLPSEKEHVTQYILNNPNNFQIGNIENPENFSDIRLTVDHKIDFDLVKIIIENFPNEHVFTLNEVLAFFKKNPKLRQMNSHILFNEGYLKSLKEDAEEKYSLS